MLSWMKLQGSGAAPWTVLGVWSQSICSTPFAFSAEKWGETREEKVQEPHCCVAPHLWVA